MPVEGPIIVPKGWGVFDNSTGLFYYDGNSPLLGSNSDKAFEKIVEYGLVDTHTAVPYYAIVQLEIVVDTGAENGDGGMLEMVVTSVSNAANRSGKVTFSLLVETVLDVELLIDQDDIVADVTFGEIGNSHIFEVEIFNAGNVESEFRIFHEDGMRGWTVMMGYEAGADCKNSIDEIYGAHLLCDIPEGESIKVSVKVTPPGGENAEIEDSFKFALSAEPTEYGVTHRKNIELTVNGEPAESTVDKIADVLGTPIGLAVIGGLVLIGFVFLTLRRRLA